MYPHLKKDASICSVSVSCCYWFQPESDIPSFFLCVYKLTVSRMDLNLILLSSAVLLINDKISLMYLIILLVAFRDFTDSV